MPQIPVIYLAFADDEQSPLDRLRDEHRHITKALLSRDDQNHFRMRGWPSAGIQEVFDDLDRYHQQLTVFHFGGHASHSFLKFVDQRGHRDGLSGLLAALPALQLIFLNGCSTAALAEQLISKGARAVIGTHFPVSDRHGAEFASRFYQYLSSQHSLEKAYQLAVDTFRSTVTDYDKTGYNIRDLGEEVDSGEELPWLLLHRQNDPEILRWTLPNVRIAVDDYPRKLTYFIPKYNFEKELVGRTQDLTRLRRHLLESRKVVLMNGMGGIGKTTLAMAYLNKYGAEYDHIAWVEQSDDLEQSIAGAEGLLENLKIDKEAMDPKTLPKAVLGTLQSRVQGQNLLILDNADEQVARLERYLPGPPDWHVLVTSRSKLSGFDLMELDKLSPEDAGRLFGQYYRREDNEPLVRRILERIEYHTLSIELIAKTAQQRRISLEELQQKLSSTGLKIKKKARIQSIHSGMETVEYLFPYLLEVFDMAALEKAEKLVLLFFSLLPPVFHPYDLLLEFWEASDRKDLEFDLVVDDLAAKGWLILENDNYKIHQVIQEIVLHLLAPDRKQFVFLVDLMAGKLFLDESRENPIDKFIWIPFGEHLVKVFSADYQEVDTLKNNLAIILMELGEYPRARDLLEQALASAIKNFGPEHPNVAVRQSNLANVYDDLGEYARARDLLEQALASAIKNFGPEHPKVAVSQSNLANVYDDLGEYDRARDLLEPALESAIKNFGPDHPTVAVRQSNLANVYKNLGEYDRAHDLLESALASDLKNFGPEHPKVAVSQSNLANVYADLGEYARARDLLEQALTSDLKNFGPHHPNVARRQSNLATVYLDLGEYAIARDLHEKALASDLKNFGPHHPNVAIRQSNLAKVYRHLGLTEEARLLWDSALKTFTEQLGAGHPHTKVVEGYLAELDKE